jgi:3-carboxy-cis,cis-muconate cycloisomerase
MARTLGVTRGLIVAEAVMMGLAPKLGRQKAHDLVYDCCRTALAGDVSFDDALLAEPEIAAAFGRAGIRALTDPGNYLGEAPQMTRALLARRAGR